MSSKKKKNKLLRIDLRSQQTSRTGFRISADGLRKFLQPGGQLGSWKQRIAKTASGSEKVHLNKIDQLLLKDNAFPPPFLLFFVRRKFTWNLKLFVLFISWGFIKFKSISSKINNTFSLAA